MMAHTCWGTPWDFMMAHTCWGTLLGFHDGSHTLGEHLGSDDVWLTKGLVIRKVFKNNSMFFAGVIIVIHPSPQI